MSYLASYKKLISDVRALFRTDRHVVWFLLASAIYRDGLAAVFSFGAVLAVSVYGLSAVRGRHLRRRGQRGGGRWARSPAA